MTQEELFLKNQGLVHMVVQRFLSRGKDREELFQLGALGLWKAVRGFEEDRGYAFSTYAMPFIMGEIRMAFRKDMAVHVTRSIQENALRIEKIKERENRPLTLEEMKELSGLSCEAIVEAMNTRKGIVSLDEPMEEVRQEKDFCEEVDNKLTVQALLERLEEKEKEVMRLRYYGGLTQSQVAKKLGMNQVAVSRMEKRILEKLRMEIR